MSVTKTDGNSTGLSTSAMSDDLPSLPTRKKKTPSPTPPKTQGSTSGLAEAYKDARDADSEDANAVASGKDTKRRRTDDHRELEQDDSHRQTGSIGEKQDRDENPVEALRRRANSGDTQESGKVSEVEGAQLNIELASESHEELMLQSSTMKRQQVASHVVSQHADFVASILKNPKWALKPHQSTTLIEQQFKCLTSS